MCDGTIFFRNIILNLSFTSNMKIIYFLLSIVLLFFSNGLQSQHMTSGVISNPEGERLPYAIILIKHLVSDSTVSRLTTDVDGKFEVKLNSGKYILTSRFLSYEDHVVEFEIKGEDLNLGRIKMQSNAEMLEEIEVRAERSMMTTQLDRRIFNVGKDLSSRGGSASDILSNVPSVGVDVEGNVSLRGSENVRILINGKESALVSDGGAFLRQLPSNMIKQIEVITNPSARYQADGETGIINIVLFDQKSSKIKGSLEASIGDPAHHGLSYIASWRNNKFGISTSYGLLYRKFKGGGELKQDFFDPALADYASERDHQRGGLNHNAMLNLDYYLNESNTVSLRSSYNNRSADNSADLQYYFSSTSQESEKEVTRMDNEEEKASDLEFNLSHIKTFGSKKHQLSSSFLISNRDDTEENIIIEENNLDPKIIRQDVSNTEDARSVIFQSDYQLPIGEEGTFEAGIRMSIRDMENDFQVLESKGNEEPSVLDNFDNIFNYDEDIYAAYLMYGNKVGKWNYQAGMRVEHSEIKTTLIKSNEVNPRNYTNLFPSGLLAYDIDSLHTLQLGFSSRITRPRLWYLFPFFTFSDNRNLASGNPNLDPELTESLELSFLKRMEKGSLMAAGLYRRGRDIIQRINELDDNGVTRSFPVNIATKHAFGAELSLSYRLTSWINVNLSNYSAYEELIGEYEGTDLSAYILNSETKVNTIVDLSKRTNVQVGAEYNSPRNTAQGRREHIAFMTLAASHKLFDNRLILTLSVNDLFNSRIRRMDTEVEEFKQFSSFQWRQRQLIFNARYNFGQQDGRK